MIRVVILLRFAPHSGVIKGENMQIFVDADARATTDLGATIKGTNVSYVTKGTDGSLFDLKLYTDCRTTIS